MSRCEQCRFFKSNPPADAPGMMVFSADGILGGGECRRNPPKMLDETTYQMSRMAVFPIVPCDAWCGQLEPCKAASASSISGEQTFHPKTAKTAGK